MRVVPIDHHWAFDQRLSVYNHGSVGHTQFDGSMEPHSSESVATSSELVNKENYHQNKWKLQLQQLTKIKEISTVLQIGDERVRPV